MGCIRIYWCRRGQPDTHGSFSRFNPCLSPVACPPWFSAATREAKWYDWNPAGFQLYVAAGFEKFLHRPGASCLPSSPEPRWKRKLVSSYVKFKPLFRFGQYFKTCRGIIESLENSHPSLFAGTGLISRPSSLIVTVENLLEASAVQTSYRLARWGRENLESPWYGNGEDKSSEILGETVVIILRIVPFRNRTAAHLTCFTSDRVADTAIR